MIKKFFSYAILLAALMLQTMEGFAQTGRSAWVEGDYSRARLLMSPASEDGSVDGGVEIQLEPGWHTYWRIPGDAGVPPQFDFSGSQNVAEIEVHYPVPERYDDGASVSVVYKDRVVFPLTVKPADPALPVSLSLSLFYGACAEVCIPVKADTETSLAPGDKPDPLAKVVISEFKGRLPRTPTEDFAVSSVTQEADQLVIEIRSPPTGRVDLFVSGPPEWFIGQPEPAGQADGSAKFRLSLKGVPAEASLDGAFDFLLVSGEQGVMAKAVPIKAPQ